MPDIKPFFNYFGGKYRIARSYPPPAYRTIIEPFAGAAGYSVRHNSLDIHLYDIDPIIYGVWDYLIGATHSEIMSLPLDVTDTMLLKIPQEAKWLIGFWLNPGTTQPRRAPSKWMRDVDPTRKNTYWGSGVRERIAYQVSYIKHWRVYNIAYPNIPHGVKATWFIDPPYAMSGHHYKYHDIDYLNLGSWCMSRPGQTIVCEQAGADWLPFTHHRRTKTLNGKKGSHFGNELIFSKEDS